MDISGVKYWLDQGTLLGLYRDKKIIEWDLDVDIGVLYEGSKKIRELLKLICEHYEIAFYDHRCNAVTILDKRSSIEKFDIAFYFPDGDNLIKIWPTHKFTGRFQRFCMGIISKVIRHNPNPLPENDKDEIPPGRNKFVTVAKRRLMKSAINIFAFFIRILPLGLKIKMCSILKRYCPYIKLVTPGYYFEDLQQLNLDGRALPIPGHVEDYLKFKYGEDWEIPDRDWNYLTDDGAVLRT